MVTLVLKITLILIYGILFIFFIRNIILKNKSTSDANTISTEGEDFDKGIPLYMFRDQYFPEDIKYTACFINNFADEAFNIFIKISPSMILTLTKIEKRMLIIRNNLASSNFNKENIQAEIDAINKNLDYLISASNTMMEKMKNIFTNANSYISTLKINNDLLDGYIDSVNLLVELRDNYNVINYEVYSKISSKYPELVDSFIEVSSKITYLLYINLITCTSRIDKNIYLFK